MDKLLSSTVKDDEIGTEIENAETTNDSLKKGDEIVENGLGEENENKESDHSQLPPNKTANIDIEITDTENQPVSSTEETTDVVAEDTLQPDEKMDVVDESSPDEEPLIDEIENPKEPDTNEVQAEAGGILRAAVDGLPVDLECTKEEPEENANADQLQSDVTNEEVEENVAAKEVDDSNQGNISTHLVTTYY